jgi:hypothetical protein
MKTFLDVKMLKEEILKIFILIKNEERFKKEYFFGITFLGVPIVLLRYTVHSPNDHSPNDHSLNDHSPNDQSPNDPSPNDHSPNDQSPNNQSSKQLKGDHSPNVTS